MRTELRPPRGGQIQTHGSVRARCRLAVSSELLVFRSHTAHGDERGYRLTSIDMLRGLVIVVMVLDHVRDFFLADLDLNFMDDPAVSPVLYVTRWITHFCAPVFVFLAGISAGLMVLRKTPTELARFLSSRGI